MLIVGNITTKTTNQHQWFALSVYLIIHLYVIDFYSRHVSSFLFSLSQVGTFGTFGTGVGDVFNEAGRRRDFASVRALVSDVSVVAGESLGTCPTARVRRDALKLLPTLPAPPRLDQVIRQQELCLLQRAKGSLANIADVSVVAARCS